jgi:phospholipid N-methyltransferase
MAGTQNLVRLSMGTGQGSSGMSTKFLEPPTALAAVLPLSTSLARKMLKRLRQDK